MKSWRSGKNTSLWARPIYAQDMLLLIKAMIEDGLVGTIGTRGVDWQHSGYSIAPIAVREAWALTPSQYKRVCDHIYENDCFHTV
tara:strand:+ start:1537 stop:1791 length:255 start_codon:yes stop_codon:yes gene_type:complete